MITFEVSSWLGDFYVLATLLFTAELLACLFAGQPAAPHSPRLGDDRWSRLARRLVRTPQLVKRPSALSSPTGFRP